VVEVPLGSSIRIDPPVELGLCSVPLGTTKVSACPEGDGAFVASLVAESNVEVAIEHEKELVCVVVDVPDVLALRLGDSDVVVVHGGNDARAVGLVEGLERSRQVHGFSDGHGIDSAGERRTEATETSGQPVCLPRRPPLGPV
jgi:hypothetical protein